MPYLQITRADGSAQKFPIERDVLTIGRAADNDLAFDDDGMSGHHCRISRDGDRYTLTDLDSTNGTLVNGQPVTESPLSPGDLVVVANTAIEFLSEEAVAVEPEAEAATVPSRSAAELPPGFELRRDTRGAGIGMLVVVSIVVLGVAVWFVRVLLKG